MKARLRNLLLAGLVLCYTATSIVAWVGKAPEWLIYLGCFIPLALVTGACSVSAFANAWASAAAERHWWKGQPVPLPLGRLSSLASGMALLSWTVAALTVYWLPHPYKAWVGVTCAVVFFASWVAGYAGWRLDQRRRGVTPDGAPLQSPADEVVRIPLRCSCGREWPVTEGAAGSAFTCTCGRTISVPSLREPRQRLDQEVAGI
jgi:hypothetical protein